MSVLRGLFLAVATFHWLAPLLSADDTPDVTIEQTEWGFDGKAMRSTFVPLSVLVRNNTPTEFEGTLRLTKFLRLNQQIDAPIERDVYVGPMSGRWVQFYPFVIDDWEQWRLSWGASADKKFDVPTPRIGEKATVLLYDPDALVLSGGVLRRFNQDLFPPTVTATDALRGVVMDAPPRWQATRRDAFLDWLNRGGRVYLLHNEQGEFPRFPQSLDVLNRESDRYRVGTGTVRRIPRTVRSLDPQFVRESILSDEQQGPYSTDQWQRYRSSPGFTTTGPQLNNTGWDRDTSILRDLQDASRFERSWILIYGLALVYLLALFPGCYLVGREVRDYRLFYAVFLVTTGVFSYGFASLGRVGGAELSRSRSVAIAHQLEDGVYDITQWTSVAAKVGDEYTIQHDGTGRLYSTAQEIEAVGGVIINGADGRLEADIPTASTRTVLHRSKLSAAHLGLQLTGIATEGDRLDQLTIRIGAGLPSDVAGVFAYYQSEFYEMKRVGDQLLVQPSTHRPAVAFLTSYFEYDPTYFSVWGWKRTSEEDDRQASEIFQGLLRPLMGNSFGLDTTIDPQALMLGPEIVRLFVYAPMPEALEIRGEKFPDQRGFVLYVVDLLTTD